MLIKCPKCRSVYDLPDNLIGDEGLKMRCSECAQVWMAYPEDGLKKVVTSTKNIQKMFRQVSKQTEELFEEEPVKVHEAIVEKVRIVNKYQRSYTSNIVMCLLALLSLLVVLVTFRYDIVRFFPKTEQTYSKFNVSSIRYGTDLEFNNVATKEYVENNVAKLQISGMVSNQSKYVNKIPPIKISVFDKNGKLLVSIVENLSLPRLEPRYNILFSTVITNPTIQAKSIYVTFEENM